jgi:uncharacterized protein (TIGR02594 family)
MSALPKQYQFLETEPGPRILTEALKHHGVKEVVGPNHNPVILRWAEYCGIKGYTADEIPWCGLFMAYVAMRAGWHHMPGNNPLWARNWAQWGVEAETASLGDVLVFVREGGGHVGVYVGEDATHYHVLGGNQKDSVCIIRIEKKRMIAARRPQWRLSEPANRRVVRLAASGPISTNEA